VTYLRRMAEGSYEPIPGRPKEVVVAGRRCVASRFETRAMPDDALSFYWFLYDLRSGLMLGGGPTLKAASEATAFLLERTPGAASRIDSLPAAAVSQEVLL
jgi:hypothetical protein